MDKYLKRNLKFVTFKSHGTNSRKKKFKVACLSSFAYLTSDRISTLLSKCYHNDSKVLMSVYEGERIIKSKTIKR